MTALADVLRKHYRLIVAVDRISAVDEHGVEIVGAFRPEGHREWRIYATSRLTSHTHNVTAVNQQTAYWHVEMLAELWAAKR